MIARTGLPCDRVHAPGPCRPLRGVRERIRRLRAVFGWGESSATPCPGGHAAPHEYATEHCEDLREGCTIGQSPYTGQMIIEFRQRP
jgi:hypothetical protein